MTDDPFQCRCVLCHGYGDRNEADRADLTIIENVQQHGWHVVMVPEDEFGPGFAYTIGLAHTHGRPELAMFGLDIHAMLNRLGAKSAAGAVLTDGQRHPDVVDGHQVTLRQVDLRWYRTFFGRAIGFYRRTTDMMHDVTVHATSIQAGHITGGASTSTTPPQSHRLHVNSPPRPIVWVDHMDDVDLLTQICRSEGAGVRCIVICRPGGMGKSALVPLYLGPEHLQPGARAAVSPPPRRSGPALCVHDRRL